MFIKTYKLTAFAIIASIFLFASTRPASSHCEIPCGIYEDTLRIQMLNEDIETIEKSMTQINTLTNSATPNYNQLVRWITNKDLHADKIQEIVWQYFMTQRIKPTDTKDAVAYKNYQTQLELLHNMLVLAMKCKQTTDLENTKKLSETVKAFADLYFHKHK